MYLPFIMELYRKLRQWHRRREAVRHLRQFDDHLLRDIGIERADIERVVDYRQSVPNAGQAAHRQSAQPIGIHPVPRAIVGGLPIH